MRATLLWKIEVQLFDLKLVINQHMYLVEYFRGQLWKCQGKNILVIQISCRHSPINIVCSVKIQKNNSKTHQIRYYFYMQKTGNLIEWGEVKTYIPKVHSENHLSKSLTWILAAKSKMWTMNCVNTLMVTHRRSCCCLGSGLNSRVSQSKACVYASHWDMQERGIALRFCSRK